MISTCPYIRNGYTKFYYNPTEKLNFTLSGFIGADGIGYDQTLDEDGQKNHISFDYAMLSGFGTLNMKWLPTDKLQIKSMVAYEYQGENMKQQQSLEGKFKYNDDFISKYGSLISKPGDLASKSYNLPLIENMMKEVMNEHMFEGKVEGEYEISNNMTAAAGIDAMCITGTTTDTFDSWNEINDPSKPLPTFKRYAGETSSDGSTLVNTAAYGVFSFGGDNTLFNGELGVRGDYFCISNSKNDFFLNSKPALNPRGTIRYTPWRDLGVFERISFSAGAGMFSTVPVEMLFASKDLQLDDCEMNKAVFSVVGTDIQLADNWNFKLEGYYRYYYSRLYMISTYDNGKTGEIFKNDGIGYSYGFDLMLQKNVGKWFDGYISYSFINAKYKNPTEPEYAGKVTVRGEPLNEWYYPEYHRFHTLNLVANFHPTSHWDLMVKGTLASGTPMRETGDVFCYPVIMEDGTVVQRYSQHSWYSDTLRTQLSCPVDIRVAYKFETMGGKLKWEIYGGAQDIFVNLYTPKGGQTFDAYTGEKSDIPASGASFNIGIPLINIGFKLSY